MSSIKEIVLKTGLSQSTVMRVLKGSTNVKPETMEKIFNAAKEIGYEINRTKSTNWSNIDQRWQYLLQQPY